VKVDPKTVATAVRENTTSSLTEPTSPAGRPGLAAQGPNRPAGLAGGGAAAPTMRTQDESSDTETENVVSHTSGQTEFIGLTPKKVTVAIGIPSGYLEQVWHQQNPTREGEERKPPTEDDLATIFQEEAVRIRSAVSNVVPHDDTLAPEQMVAVNRFTSLPEPLLPTLGFSEKAVAWLSDYWTTVGTFGLACVSLLMLRSMVRSGSSSTPMPPEVNLPTPGEEEAPKPIVPAIKRRLETAPSLRDELGDMVRENPDAAANILRSWIGSSN
jgi:flagellar M-ring protein FliF